MIEGTIKISVIVPLYNKARYIARAVDSVLAQSYTDFELIVVDDGSTDGSSDIVRQYSDPRIRVITQENAGECAARNRGVEEAKYDLVAFLDADDEWHQCFLLRTLSAINCFDGAVAVFSNFVFVNTTQTMTLAIRCDEKSSPCLIQDYFRFVLYHGMGMCSSVVMLKKNAIMKANGFPVGRKVGGDLDTWFRLACIGKIVFVPQVLATYYTGIGVCAEGTTNMDVWDSYQSWHQANRIPDELKRSARALAVNLRLKTALAWWLAGKKTDARKLLTPLNWSELLTHFWIISCIVFSLPLIPDSLRWGIVRRVEKFTKFGLRNNQQSLGMRYDDAKKSFCTN
jgi:glycosyltransferase involved in cell wall biosynthesis